MSEPEYVESKPDSESELDSVDSVSGSELELGSDGSVSGSVDSILLSELELLPPAPLICCSISCSVIICDSSGCSGSSVSPQSLNFTDASSLERLTNFGES